MSLILALSVNNLALQLKLSAFIAIDKGTLSQLTGSVKKFAGTDIWSLILINVMMEILTTEMDALINAYCKLDISAVVRTLSLLITARPFKLYKSYSRSYQTNIYYPCTSPIALILPVSSQLISGFKITDIDLDF